MPLQPTLLALAVYLPVSVLIVAVCTLAWARPGIFKRLSRQLHAGIQSAEVGVCERIKSWMGMGMKKRVVMVPMHKHLSTSTFTSPPESSTMSMTTVYILRTPLSLFLPRPELVRIVQYSPYSGESAPLSPALAVEPSWV
ncbi:uncharacterized protein BDR25DRAFT_319231 [Lindgomyces ingoldianus]|uniref:Uncharacterized protein n=1 Tax=Lindgomyces ingoldianus TaxID=673940 RepID=A0ACB6QD21_9PLEO|nr:uncharacterized protein BDR25DRAFT_319231 [Lindgomyces ingoldianus]KAF2464513.1 hypothetical protein BDR25DRAFT_319231 [Lindgomyces ingoldianus]